jgi:hypothetical protein
MQSLPVVLGVKVGMAFGALHKSGEEMQSVLLARCPSVLQKDEDVTRKWPCHGQGKQDA